MMTTSHFTRKQNPDFISNYEFDSLIKKFSNNSTQQQPKQHDANIIKSNFDVLNHSLSSAHSIQELKQQAKANNLHYKKLIENICQNNLQNHSQTKTKLNEQIVSDRAKFFNTLKSLFAIFDPGCRGFIDINELNNLGAQKNEILNDVINYLLNKKDSNYEFSNNLYFLNANSKQPENTTKINTDSRSSSGNSSRSSSTNSIQLKTDETKNNFIKNLRIKSKETISPALIKSAKKLESNNLKTSTTSSSASPTSTKSSLSSSINQLSNNLEGYYVTFEEFINAADIVLDKRKKEKILMQSNRIKENQQQIKSFSYLDDGIKEHINSEFVNDSTQSTGSFNRTGNSSSNLFQSGSTSLNNIYKSSENGYVNKLTLMRSSMQPPPPPPPPPIDYNTIQRPKIQKNRLSLNTNQNTHGNYMPLLNAFQNFNNQTSSSSSINSTNGATLSQAFENVTNTFENTKLSKDFHTSNNKPMISENLNFINNANSFDLGGLIDKENFLLQQGLADIEQIKQWYSSQLRDNRQKHANIKQLKRQNLFSIDKMLTDLKSLNDLNSVLSQFLSLNKERDITGDADKKENFTVRNTSYLSNSDIQAPLPTYKDYVESFELNKTDSEIDQYLKEKSEKIESLQKEKSNLIRRLFEMKSESANLNHNIIQLQTNSQSLTNNLKVSSPVAKNTLIKQQNYERLPNHVDTSLITNNRSNQPNANSHITPKAKVVINPSRASLNHSTICNFIELPNAGFTRTSDFSSRSTAGLGYYPQQQNFQAIHNRSPT